MKQIALFISLFSIFIFGAQRASGSVTDPSQFLCDLENPLRSYGKNHLYACKAKSGNAPVFYVASLEGSFAEVSRAHGYLLGQEAESGVAAESLNHVDRVIARQSMMVQPALLSLVKCFGETLYRQLTPEFQGGVDGFYQGYAERMRNLGQTPRFSTEQLRFASVGIELDNVLDSISHNGTMLFSALKHCPSEAAQIVPFGLLGGLFGGIASIVDGKTPFKLGCTGYVVPGKLPSGVKLTEGGLIHGRNLDGELMRSWNKAPALFLVRETGYLPYLATGTAGMIYPGGISGFNSAGISVSLHQMYSADTAFGAPKGSSIIAPFLQQQVLREAKSISEAEAILKRLRSIASWTILIGDSKTGESASIELSKLGVIVARKAKAMPLGQSNHFVSKEQQASVYFPNLNKKLETHTRLEALGRSFARLEANARAGRPWTVQQAIEQLANHEDANGNFQTFGTTAAKAYGIMSTVMLPEKREIWMTAGDFMPSAHASYIGFSLDESMKRFVFSGTKRDQQFATRPNLMLSLQSYVKARLLYEHDNLEGAEKLLREAISLSAKDGVDDPSYRFILARLLTARQKFDEAEQEYKNFLGLKNSTRYQQALGILFRGINRQYSSESGIEALRPQLNRAKEEFAKAYATYGETESKLNVATVEKLLTGESVSLQKIDWVVIR